MLARFRRLIFPTDREKEATNKLFQLKPIITDKAQLDRMGGLPPILPVRIGPRLDN